MKNKFDYLVLLFLGFLTSELLCETSTSTSYDIRSSTTSINFEFRKKRILKNINQQAKKEPRMEDRLADCPENCVNCKGKYIEGKPVSICELCKKGFRLSQDLQCEKCRIPHCDFCRENLDSCNICQSNFFLKKESKTTSTCEQCVSHCVSCSNSKTCQECEAYWKVSPKSYTCVPDPVGKFVQIYRMLLVICLLMILVPICYVLFCKKRLSEMIIDNHYNANQAARMGDSQRAIYVSREEGLASKKTQKLKKKESFMEILNIIKRSKKPPVLKGGWIWVEDISKYQMRMKTMTLKRNQSSEVSINCANCLR